MAMNLDVFRERLDGIRERRDGFLAKCPAHQDRDPSLSVTDSGDRVLLHCFAGCTPADILAAIGLTWREAFRDEYKPEQVQPSLRVHERRKLAKSHSLEFTILEIEAVRPATDPADVERVNLARKRIASLAARYGFEELDQIAQEWESGEYLKKYRTPSPEALALVRQEAAR